MKNGAPPVETELKALFRKNTKIGSFTIAKFLAKKYSIKTINSRKERDLYIYKDNYYQLGMNFLRNEAQNLLEELGTTNAKNEIVEKIRDLTIINRDEFTVDRNFINLTNGILNIQTKELLPHGPEFLFLYKLPLEFNPEAPAPNIEKFLADILLPQDIPVLQEWFGYCLYRLYFIKKAMILIGERDTGKTTLLNLLGAFVGKENLSGVSLQRISSDKFAAAQLYNKHLNIFDDLSFKDISDTGSFKIATGGGIITGEYKFGDQFHFENYSKLTFACNKIPVVKDSSDDAYFSRWIIIQFEKFIAEPDKFLIDKLTTKEEMSGLLNLALEGLHRLLANHDFSYNKEPEEIRVEMLRSGSAIANFAYDCLEEEPNAWISKDELYRQFTDYAKEQKLPIATIINFGRKIPSYASYILDSKQLNDTGKQITGWRNVKLKQSNVGQSITPELAIDIMGGDKDYQI